MKSGIYLIKNIFNGKIYIGSSVNIDKRWSDHLSSLKNNKHNNKKLQNSWNKYSGCYFVFGIIEYVDKYSLIDREQFYLNSILEANLETNKFNKIGYNILRIANKFEVLSGSKNPFYGKKHSDETKKKMSEKKMGSMNPHYGRGPMLGRKLTEETKKKMSISSSGSNNPCSKKILQYTLDYILIKEWDSSGEISRILKISQGNISSCCLGKRKTAYGCIWRFK